MAARGKGRGLTLTLCERDHSFTPQPPGRAPVETVSHLTPGKGGLRRRHEKGALMAPLLAPCRQLAGDALLVGRFW